MALAPEQLTEIGQRFLTSLNARDFATAASLYSADATYESASLVSDDNPDGLITGRDQVMKFFADALEGDDSFQLTALDIFTGLNLAVIVSSLEGRTFMDVLRLSEEGLIVGHAEVTPKVSPIGGV